MLHRALTPVLGAAAAAVLFTAAPEGRSADVPDTAQSLVAVKQRMMSADYRADMEGLLRLRDEASALAEEPANAHLAYYWAGFAGWRLAMNGASREMTPKEMRAHLVRAVGDFQAAIRHRQDFADAYAAAGSAVGWLTALSREDPASVRGHVAELDRLLALARELGPDNPRVLWVLGADRFARPKEFGGDRDQAMKLYRRALELAGEAQPHSPLPDWGKAETHMALANAHLHSAVPDLDAAAREARAALGMRPDWSYVRDTLLPQIQRASAKKSRTHD